MEKIFTFEFHFVNPNTGKDDQTQFCASTQAEAISLFTSWCQQDEKYTKVPNPTSIEVVYNEDDAAEIGESYGKPEDYNE